MMNMPSPASPCSTIARPASNETRVPTSRIPSRSSDGRSAKSGALLRAFDSTASSFIGSSFRGIASRLSKVSLDDPLDEGIEDVLRVPVDRAMPHPLEEVVLALRREVGDLLPVLRRRLDVLRERDDVHRDLARGE